MNAITSRLSEVAKVPALVKDTAINSATTVYGAFAAIASTVTFAKFAPINDRIVYLVWARPILLNIVFRTLRIINPNASLSIQKVDYQGGIISSYVASKANENTLPTRVKIVVTGTVLSITKVVDLALGLIAAVAALLSAGFSVNLNSFALKQLRSFDVVTLPFAMINGLVDPRSRFVHMLLFTTT